MFFELVPTADFGDGAGAVGVTSLCGGLAGRGFDARRLGPLGLACRPAEMGETGEGDLGRIAL
jgi:hypothetical protein